MLKFSQFYLLGFFLFESYIPQLMYIELYLKLTQYQVKSILFLSQHLKRAKVNSERQFSYLVSRTYIASV